MGKQTTRPWWQSWCLFSREELNFKSSKMNIQPVPSGMFWSHIQCWWYITRYPTWICYSKYISVQKVVLMTWVNNPMVTLYRITAIHSFATDPHPKKHYMAEPLVQLADMNTQTVVPELSVHFSRSANTPVNLTDAGDPLSDPHPVQSASNGMPFVSSYGFSCAQKIRNISRSICADSNYKWYHSLLLFTPLSVMAKRPPHPYNNLSMFEACLAPFTIISKS